jgi:energy-coupling factor transporter ATP-binding protein EcfA2
LKDLSLNVDDYTVLVGPNGSGKSSVLYALDWFFNGGSLTEDDIHSTSSDGEPGEDDKKIDVEVTFGDLNEEDRRVLGKYGYGETAWFRRFWPTVDGKDKMIGNSRQGPGFAAIRGADGVATRNAFYRSARELHPGLDAATTKDAMLEQLDLWESDSANAGLLEEVEGSDASHMCGFNGEHVLARRVRLILVPASADIVGQISATGKSNAVSQLVGALMLEAASSARSKWETDNADQLTQLSDAIKSGVEQSIGLQAKRVNELLASLVPSATVDFVPEIPSWSIKGDASIQTDVVIDGERKDVSRQGHGIQRAVMISMLQALVPDELAARAAADEGDGEDPEATSSSTSRAIRSGSPAVGSSTSGGSSTPPARSAPSGHTIARKSGAPSRV